MFGQEGRHAGSTSSNRHSRSPPPPSCWSTMGAEPRPGGNPPEATRSGAERRQTSARPRTCVFIHHFRVATNQNQASRRRPQRKLVEDEAFLGPSTEEPTGAPNHQGEVPGRPRVLVRGTRPWSGGPVPRMGPVARCHGGNQPHPLTAPWQSGNGTVPHVAYRSSREGRLALPSHIGGARCRLSSHRALPSARGNGN